MSLASVRAFLAERAPDIEILEATTSTATVALAAAAHGVEPARIAKTLSLRLGGEAILIVMGGEARLDIVPRHAVTCRVHPRKIELSLGVAQRSGHAIPFRGLGVVLPDAQAKVVHDPQAVLRGGNVLLGKAGAGSEHPLRRGRDESVALQTVVRVVG